MITALGLAPLVLVASNFGLHAAPMALFIGVTGLAIGVGV